MMISMAIHGSTGVLLQCTEKSNVQTYGVNS